jgi:protoheme IX farnesyltransferase
MYRADYARAGLRLMAGGERAGTSMSWQVTAFSILLIPASILPAAVGLTEAWWYVVGAIGLGVAHLLAAVRLGNERSGEAARGLLRASVMYLPALLALLAVGARWSGT